MKVKDFVLIVLFMVFLCILNVRVNDYHQEILNNKLDSILIMQEKIYELDSMYLKSTRVHMGQCSFILKEGVLADINN